MQLHNRQTDGVFNQSLQEREHRTKSNFDYQKLRGTKIITDYVISFNNMFVLFLYRDVKQYITKITKLLKQNYSKIYIYFLIRFKIYI